jgi:hypothetical protein
MTDFTSHFRFPIPDFTQEPWHAELQTAIRAIDTALYQAILIQNVGNWANSTVYAVGSIVIDSATGLMWTCAVANTSSVAPTTFAQERVAHPTYWNATANIPQQRGTWTTATSYIPGDFVVDTNRYAVCLIAHVSGVFNTDLAAGRWVVLIDLSSLGVGINATAEGTIASAATTNIGSVAATRINVTGVTGITSFGVVANTYKILRFSGILTITGSAAIILIGGGPRTTAAGDIMWVASDSVGNWRELMFNAASGIPLAVPNATTAVRGIIEIATQGEVDLGTDPDRAVAPDTLAVRLGALSTAILATIRDGVSGTLDTLAEIATAMGLLAPKASPTFTGTSTFDQISATGLANLAGGTTLPAGDISMADLAATASPFERQHYHIREEQTNGTDGGLLTHNSWNTCVLNAEMTDNLTITPSGNQLSLVAGTYVVEADAMAHFTGLMQRASGEHADSKLRIRNITDGTTLLAGLSARFAILDDGGGNDESADFTLFVRMSGVITLAGTKTIELQHWVFDNFASSPTIRSGKAVSSGEKEVYTDLRLWKIA